MPSKSPTLVKVVAVLLGIMSLRAAIGSGVMIWRFGAVWDAAFFLGIAACLLFVALGMYQGKMNGLGLSVSVLATVAARLMLDAAPIIKYDVPDPVKWVPLAMALGVGASAILLLTTPSARRWFAESRNGSTSQS